MEPYTDVVTKLGLPAGLLLLLLVALGLAIAKVARWGGERVDRAGAFLAPLFVRLVDATEANSRTSEATLQMMHTLNQTIAWNHDRMMELTNQIQSGVVQLGRGQEQLGDRVLDLERRLDHGSEQHPESAA